MKKELNGGVVVGVLIVVVLAVVAVAWKAIGPPAPAGIKSFDKASLKVMQEKHAASAEETRQQQSQLFEKAHRGGQ